MSSSSLIPSTVPGLIPAVAEPNNNKPGIAFTPSTSSSSHVAISKTLQCPMCYSVPRGKIFCCNEDHPMCEECFLKLKDTLGRDGGPPSTKVLKCRMGKKCLFWIKNPHRSRLCEKLVRELGYRFDCANADMGCKEKLRVDELHKHETYYFECKYMPVKCPSLMGCRVSRTTLLAHYKEHHSRLTPTLNYYSFWDEYDGPDVTLTMKPEMLQVDGQGDKLTVFPFVTRTKQHLFLYLRADVLDPKFKNVRCEIKARHSCYDTIYRGPITDLDDELNCMEGWGLSLSGETLEVPLVLNGDPGHNGELRVQFSLWKEN